MPDIARRPRKDAPRSARNSRLVLLMGLLSCAFAGCVSVEQRAASDKEECKAQGYAPSTSAFDDCLAAAAVRHDQADARQSQRMRQLHERDVDSFLTSTSIIP